MARTAGADQQIRKEERDMVSENRDYGLISSLYINFSYTYGIYIDTYY